MSLSPEAERLLQRTKHLDDPSQADRAAMRARLSASWLAADQSAEATDVRRQAVSRWTKIAWGVLSVVALIGAGAWVRGQLMPAALPPSAASPVAPSSDCTGDCAPAVARAVDPSLEPPRLGAVHAPEPVPAAAESRTPSLAREPRPVRRALRASERSASTEQRRATAPNTSPALPLQAAAAAPQVEAAPVREPPISTGPSAYAKAEPVPDEPAPARAPAPVESAIDDELALLGDAQDALRAGQPERALRLVQSHGFRFPNGALAQERMTVHVLALCALSRPNSARQVYAQLRRSVADAPVLERVRADCGF